MRQANLNDIRDILEIYSDEETLKYQAMNTFETREESEKYIQRILNGFENRWFIRWGIEEKTSNKLIGLIALHHIDDENNSAKIGYILNRQYWNKSVMSHNLQSLIDFLKNETSLKIIQAQIHPDNIGSIKLAEKMGFKQIGYMTNAVVNPTTSLEEDRLITELEHKV